MKKNKRHSIRYTLAAVLFCLAMGAGFICFADEKGTVTVASAKIRASADASSEQLGSVSQGGTVDIVGETTGTDGRIWYQVYVDANTKGYIRSDLVSKSGGSAPAAPAASNADQTTSVTPVEAKKATVTTNQVRIRKGASTSHDVVATANRGMVVTVNGEASGSDGKKWYRISFTYKNKEITGFIRSDLVTFDNVPADSVTSQITGVGNAGETPPEEAPAETQPEPEQPEQAAPAAPPASDPILMNVEDEPYIMPGFNAVTLNWNEQKINAYKNGSFFIYYARMADGEEGWYLFDSDRGVYQRYVYATAGAPDDKGGIISLIPVIALAVIVVILAAVVVALAIKLRSYGGYDDSYDDSYDEEEGDDYPGDDIDDLEELDEAPVPARHPQPSRRSPVPARHPQPQGDSSPVPARHPYPQGNGSPVPARHPQPQGNGSPAPARHPQPQGNNAPMGHPQGNNAPVPVRRPHPQGNSSPQPARPSRPSASQGHPQGGRPQPPKDRPQPQRGAKAGNDDDMDFMEI